MGNILSLYSHLMIFLFIFMPIHIYRCNCGHYSTTHHTQSKIQIRHVSQEQTFRHTSIYKNSFDFVPKSRSHIPKVTLGTGFQSVKSTFVFRREKVRIIRVKRK
jgi:hypothetical protein